MRILCLPGDGIGPEILSATKAVLAAASAAYRLGLEFDRREIGLAALAAEGTTIPEAVIAAARAADGVVLGPVSHTGELMVEQGVAVALRKITARASRRIAPRAEIDC